MVRTGLDGGQALRFWGGRLWATTDVAEAGVWIVNKGSKHKDAFSRNTEIRGWYLEHTQLLEWIVAVLLCQIIVVAH